LRIGDRRDARDRRRHREDPHAPRPRRPGPTRGGPSMTPDDDLERQLTDALAARASTVESSDPNSLDHIEQRVAEEHKAMSASRRWPVGLGAAAAIVVVVGAVVLLRDDNKQSVNVVPAASDSTTTTSTSSTTTSTTTTTPVSTADVPHIWPFDSPYQI